MKNSEIANILKKTVNLESKLKELLARNEQNKEAVVVKEKEIATEHQRTKENVAEFERKLVEIFNEWKKLGLSKDEIISKQKELISEIKKAEQEQSQIYIKEYTELHTTATWQIRELKDWAEKCQQEAREEIKKSKRLVWMVGIVVGIVSIIMTALGCYLIWGRK